MLLFTSLLWKLSHPDSCKITLGVCFLQAIFSTISDICLKIIKSCSIFKILSKSRRSTEKELWETCFNLGWASVPAVIIHSFIYRSAGTKPLSIRQGPAHHRELSHALWSHKSTYRNWRTPPTPTPPTQKGPTTNLWIEPGPFSQWGDRTNHHFSFFHQTASKITDLCLWTKMIKTLYIKKFGEKKKECNSLNGKQETTYRAVSK